MKKRGGAYAVWLSASGAGPSPVRWLTNSCFEWIDSNYVDQVTAWGGKPTSPEDIENFIPGLLGEPKNPMRWTDFAEKYGAGSSLTGVFH